MNYKRALKTAVSIWVMGVLLFVIAAMLPLSDNPELQANISLALAFIPLGWYGAKYYYKKGSTTPVYQLAFLLVFVAALLDALITVPIFFFPMGVDHQTFFGAIEFWLLIAEYAGIVILYDYLNRKKELRTA
ncbi:DUF5367 family protein [Aureitalea marina]|uniref:DUF5367 domain-containing protein n=1 Tax=Aureitalea marina TaxID=930804 RepID=A0A2S7KTB4_9FLAO|nr:DUF5367 family protein [Aureitalea marina]PQB05869.1 hypothetical protein BST85_13900 [Aureitalea marina]